MCTEALALFVLSESMRCCNEAIKTALAVMAAINSAAMLMGVIKALQHLVANKKDLYESGDKR